MRFLSTLLLLASAVSAHASFDAETIANALETRYGPIDAHQSFSVIVATDAHFDERREFSEQGLPNGFLAVVWDERSSRFAVLVSGDDGRQRRLSGTAFLQTEVPVLTRRIQPGEVIQPGDVELNGIPSRSVPSEGIVTAADGLVGKEATRLLSPGRPVPLDMVATPSAVRKNDDVELIFRKGPLEVRSAGKSLNNAAIGETVKVARPDAIRLLEGIVVSHGVILITGNGVNR